jgi:serine/threonine-protein kinase
VEGTPFGRYRLIELLGRGGMGEVWRAYDTDTDRVVALKLLPAHLSEDEDFQRRFRREAHAAARLNDPHVIPIHHYGEIDGRLYVDMRLVEGRDLQGVLADGPLEPARAVRIIGQVAEALHAAHQVGLLHRDIKPSNILLGHNDFAYLIDFGIARAADETRMTKSGFMIGTFQYIAPERLAIGADEDARADIYSLACVLYECLTGSPPFPGDTMPQLVAAHLSAPPPRPSASQPLVPAPVDEVIARGMAKDPDQRYSTTVELAEAAHQALTTPTPHSTAMRRATVPDSPATLPAASPPAAVPISTPNRQRPAPEAGTSAAKDQSARRRKKRSVASHGLSRKAFASVLAGVVLVSISIGDSLIPYPTKIWLGLSLGDVPKPLVIWETAIVLVPLIGSMLLVLGRGRSFPGRTITGSALVSISLTKVLAIIVLFF